MDATVVPLRPPRAHRGGDGAFLLLAGSLGPANRGLLAAARAWFRRAEWVRGEQLAARAGPGDVVLARLDVRRSFDGVEPGLWDLRALEEAHPGITVLNTSSALITCHDKLATALALAAADVPHPRTSCVESPSQLDDLAPPLVVKPRFGSWGTAVARCDSPLELKRCFRRIAKEPWFQQNGALVQELVPPPGHDLRVVVSGGRVVGAVERVAAPGEWRTNVALGASRRPVARVPAEAVVLAARAAAAVGADLAGVDLLPLPDGGWTVLELNGAAEFSAPYALDGDDVYARALAPLLEPRAEPLAPPDALEDAFPDAPAAELPTLP